MGLVEEVFKLLAQGFVHGGWEWMKLMVGMIDLGWEL